MTEQRPLPKALDDLAEVVTDLCDPITRTVLRDDLTATEHTEPSLLDRLAALGHSGETGKSRGTPNRLPLDATLLDLLLELESAAADLHDRAMMHSRLSIEQHVRQIAELAQNWSHPQAVLWVVDHLRQWRRMIESAFDPPRRAHIAAPCPACDVRMVWRPDPTTGERVQVPALSVDGHVGCTCLACGAHWPPQQLEHLARVLGCEPVKEAS